MKNLLKFVVIVIIGLIMSLLPAPEGLTQDAWIFFSLFVCVFIALILEPLPSAYIVLLGVVIAFMFALGYEKTGLGKRISLVLVSKMGKSTLGLGYAIAMADLILAPFMPSNTARSGGPFFQ